MSVDSTSSSTSSSPTPLLSFFLFYPTATTEIYTLSLHDALPICAVIEVAGLIRGRTGLQELLGQRMLPAPAGQLPVLDDHRRSEEHTSELQSRGHLVCRLLLEKKKN